jgi:RTX calcium-binding nonapeptide repeat (4 copies)
MNVRRFAVAAVALVTLVAVGPVPGAVARDVKGTARADSLTGTARADLIEGGAGDDILRGRGGSDRLLGGAGDDLVRGGAGRDRLRGQQGNDRLYGGRGPDHISGDRNRDFLSGGQGPDVLEGGPAADTAVPDRGADVVRMGGGRDRVVVEPDGHADVIDCGDGEDSVVQVATADPADTFVGCEHVELQPPTTPDDTAAAEGKVFALAAAGGRTIVGGRFTKLGARARKNVGALLPNGTVDRRFVANANGKVEAVAVSADGSTVFIGGSFSTVNGVARANLAAVDARTGAVLTHWSADTRGHNPTVESLAVHGNRLYVGGRYNGIDGTPRSKLSAVGTASGDVILAFHPRPNGPVREVVVTPDGTSVFAGGGFTRLGGAARPGRAGAVDANGDATAFAPAVPDLTGVATVALSPDGSRFFLSTQRGNLVLAYDWATSDRRVWAVKANGNTQAIAASKTQVYLGGHWSRLEGSRQRHLGSVDVDSGVPTSWDTSCTGGRMGVWALLVQDSRLHVGGVFERFGQVSQRGYARFAGSP